MEQEPTLDLRTTDEETDGGTSKNGLRQSEKDEEP